MKCHIKNHCNVPLIAIHKKIHETYFILNDPISSLGVLLAIKLTKSWIKKKIIGTKFPIFSYVFPLLSPLFPTWYLRKKVLLGLWPLAITILQCAAQLAAGGYNTMDIILPDLGTTEQAGLWPLFFIFILFISLHITQVKNKKKRKKH